MAVTGLQNPSVLQESRALLKYFYVLNTVDFNVADGRKSKAFAVLKPNNYLQGSIFAKFRGGFRCSEKGLWELAVKQCLEFQLIKTKRSNPSRVKEAS